MKEYTRNLLRTPLIIFMLLSVGLVFFPSAAGAEAEINFEETYYDPYDDIQVVAQEGHFVTGSQWKDLDITEMNLKSETSSLVGGIGESTDISMSVTVKGTVRDDEQYIYGVYLTVGSSEYTMVYKEKAAIGVKMDTGGSILPHVSGVGTSTIVFTVEESKIGNPKSPFNWNAMAIERSDDGNYGDLAPNKLVKITDPWDRETVAGSITIKGVTRESSLTYEKVELQVDSRSSSGWKTVTDKGDLSNWEYILDTRTLGDRDHTINARLTDDNGEEFLDEIVIKVDPDVVASPPATDERPDPHVGDRYVFGISDDASDKPEVINIDISTTSDMEATVVGQDEKVGPYDCWKMSTSQSGELTLGGITFNFDTEGEIYLEGGFLNITKEDSTVTIDSALTEAQEQHKVSTYEPPKLRYDFPVEVTGAWSCDTSADRNVDGKTSTDTLQIDYKCLFSENTGVPGGSFESYAVRSQNRDAAFYKVEYYSPLIGYPVRVETFDIDDKLIGVLVLNSYSMKDTFIKVSGAPSFETDDENGKVYVDDEVDFTVSVRNSGKGKADDALVVGMVKSVDSAGDYEEFDRKEIRMDSGETETVSLTWTPEEKGNFWFKFITYSDSSDTSVWDGEIIYDGEITVMVKSTGPDPDNNIPLFVGIAAVVVVVIIIVVVVVKKKGGSRRETRPAEISVVEPEMVEEVEEVVVFSPEEPEVVIASEERGTGTGTGEGEVPNDEKFACPTCGHELSGDESECPECGIAFEDMLGQIDEAVGGGGKDE